MVTSVFCDAKEDLPWSLGFPGCFRISTKEQDMRHPVGMPLFSTIQYK